MITRSRSYDDQDAVRNNLGEILNIHADDEVCGHRRSTASLVDSGMMLTDLVYRTNDAFGGMIFNIYCTCLLSSTIALYGASYLFLPVTVFKKQLMWTFVISELFLVQTSFLRIYYLTNATENLKRTIKTSKARAENLIKSDNCISTGRINVLRYKLGVMSESPITPLSTFSLSNATFLSASATIITYLMILIQFKLTERKF